MNISINIYLLAFCHEISLEDCLFGDERLLLATSTSAQGKSCRWFRSTFEMSSSMGIFPGLDALVLGEGPYPNSL